MSPTDNDDFLFGAETFDTGIAASRDDETEREQPIQGLVKQVIDDAIQWRQENLDPELEKATKYYKGEPYGDEQEGRSQVRTTEVRDTVRSVLPSLLRVFLGPERVVEFSPDGPEDVPEAEQQTEYVNHVVQEDNDAFLTFHATFKDALVRKLGIIKWWWDEREEIVGAEHSGLTEDELLALSADDGVELEDVAQTQEPVFAPVPNGVPQMVQPALYDATVVRRVTDGRIKIAAVPPEEFIFSPKARSKEDARMVGHVRDVPASDLRAMGVPKKMVDRAVHHTAKDLGVELKAARTIDDGASESKEDEQDPSTLPVRFAELYMLVDVRGEGIAELRKIQAVGPSCEIFSNEPAPERPFALFPTDPEPHTLVPMSLADSTMDLQRIQSHLLRGTLDSLTQTLDPSTEVVEDEVNMKDVLSTEASRVIRVRRPGMVREIVTPFVGGEALAVMDRMDAVKEDRTGVSKAAAGLDADALQSSTRAAVAATVSAAKEQKEMIARVFAETGMKQLFQGLLRLVVRHQDRPRMVRLRNEYVQVDPRYWNADKDVTVNVALGTGLVEEKVQMLAMIAEKQEQQLMQGSPLVTLEQYRNTLKRIVELSGFQNADEFFLPFGQDQQRQWQQQQAQQAEQPTETEALMQVEMAKLQQRAEEKAAERQLEQQKLAQELAIEEARLRLQAGEQAVDADVEAARVEIEAARTRIEGEKVAASGGSSE